MSGLVIASSDPPSRTRSAPPELESVAMLQTAAAADALYANLQRAMLAYQTEQFDKRAEFRGVYSSFSFSEESDASAEEPHYSPVYTPPNHWLLPRDRFAYSTESPSSEQVSPPPEAIQNHRTPSPAVVIGSPPQHGDSLLTSPRDLSSLFETQNADHPPSIDSSSTWGEEMTISTVQVKLHNPERETIFVTFYNREKLITAQYSIAPEDPLIAVKGFEGEFVSFEIPHKTIELLLYNLKIMNGWLMKLYVDRSQVYTRIYPQRSFTLDLV